MAKARKKKQPTVKSDAPQDDYRPIKRLRVKPGDDLKTIYAKIRKAFTAADLAAFTRDEPMMPAEELVQELDTMVAEARKRKRKRGTQ